jgi:hypothetical protein
MWSMHGKPKATGVRPLSLGLLIRQLLRIGHNLPFGTRIRTAIHTLKNW